jgi:hypothetical protein
VQKNLDYLRQAIIVYASENDTNSMFHKSTSAASNSVMASVGKSIKKYGQSLVHVAKIDVDKNVRIAEMHCNKEKERVNQVQMEMHKECINYLERSIGVYLSMLLKLRSKTR